MPKLIIPADLNKNDVIDNLTSTATDLPLSAAKGKELNDSLTTLSTSLNNYKTQTDNIKDYIVDISPVDTKTSAVVSINDAAPLNAENVTIAIEPVQDLHGYDNPWPGGSGKNLFDQDTLYARYKQSDGSYRGDSAAIASIKSYIPASLVGKTLVFSAYVRKLNGVGELNAGVCAVVDGTSIFGNEVNSTNYTQSSVSFTPISTNDYVKFLGSSWTSMQFKDAQLEIGETATDFNPYANTCPITGWTGTTVWNTGKNLMNPALFDTSHTSVSNGVYTVDTTGYRVNLYSGQSGINHSVSSNVVLPILQAGTYVFSYKFESGSVFDTIETVDENGKRTSINAINIENNTYKAYKFTLSKVSRITITGTNNNTSSFIFSEPMIEIGETRSTYEPFVGNTIPISWQSEADMAYGGMLNLTTGILTIDRANITSYAGETLPGAWISSMDVYTVGSTPTTGAQVVYELEAPVIYQLTPVEVTMLHGMNNIWANTGNTTLTYYKDSSISFIPTYSSTDTYDLNTYTTYNNKIYRCISAITTAEEWTPSHWIETTDILTAIQSSANNITNKYSSARTYFIGDYCIHEGLLFKCIVAINTPEEWMYNHWQFVSVMDEVNTKIDALQIAPLALTIPVSQWSQGQDDYYVTINASNVTADSILIPSYDQTGLNNLTGSIWCVPSAGSFTLRTTSLPRGEVNVLI